VWTVRPPRVKQRNRQWYEGLDGPFYGGRKGSNWYAPYDRLNKRSLVDPPALEKELGGFLAGKVWDWLEETTVEWYEKHTTAKEFARWERVLERRKLKAVDRKLDAARGAA
jgi:hypothetical protein